MPPPDVPVASPTFSVVTATFNAGRKLLPTAASVRAQDASAEHIIIDGGSSDESLTIARQLAREDPQRVRVFSGPDAGIYDALNKGVGRSTGRYVYFLGAGDTLLPGALAAVAARLPSGDRSLVYGNAILDGKVYAGAFRWQTLIEKNICQQAIFYGRDIFRTLGNFNGRYRNYADWEFNLRCFGSRKINRLYLPIIIAEYEMGGSSRSGDTLFEREKTQIILQSLGIYYWTYLNVRKIWRDGRRRFGFG